MDANIDLLKLDSQDFPKNYMNVNISNGFLQIVCKATRIQGNHFSLIDHILTNTNLVTYDVGTLLSDISDHLINFICLPDEKSKQKPKEIFKRIFNSENVQRFKGSLANLNWLDTLSKNDVNEAFDSFWTVFNDLYKLNFPQVKVKFNRNIHKINQYMTNGLIISRAKKLELYKKFLKERNIEASNKYKKYRNLFNTLVRQAKKSYFNENFDKCKKDPKKTWDLLKEAANLKKPNSNIEKLISDNTPITDPGQIAEQFNNFFVKIGPEIAKSVTKTNCNPEDFMPNLDNLNNLEFNDTTPTLICDILKSMHPKNSMDSDGLSCNLLKQIKNEISLPIAHIFNLSIRQGCFPEKLKKSRTVPIFKSGDQYSTDNYRPISLLSQLSKILEKIVSVQLVNHLDRNNIIYEHQYGFQKGKSTEQNLVQALNFIGTALNENKYCIGVFFDLKKAFDVCSYDILIMKLGKIGITGMALEWFKSYLSNRKQFVDINGVFSSEQDILTCILQGSILGPILFLTYINDLFLVSRSLTLMFADDTFALKSDSNLNKLISDMNTDINRMAVWFKANRLAVNKGKTKYMIFRVKGKQIPNDCPPLLYDENERDLPFNQDHITVLERYHDKHAKNEGRAYKLLGIFLDEHLTFDFHVQHLISKLNKSMYCIRMAKNILNYKGMRALYFALIHSHLSYCPAVMSCFTTANKSKLAKIQKKAIRLMTNSRYNAHTAELFLINNILPFDQILKQGRLIFMHAINFNYAPVSFRNIWIKNELRPHDAVLRNNDLFKLPHPRIEIFKRFPIYALPEEWNNAGNLIYYENQITFRHALRNFLCEEIQNRIQS